jgi:hypothetical protein
MPAFTRLLQIPLIGQYTAYSDFRKEISCFFRIDHGWPGIRNMGRPLIRQGRWRRTRLTPGAFAHGGGANRFDDSAEARPAKTPDCPGTIRGVKSRPQFIEEEAQVIAGPSRVFAGRLVVVAFIALAFGVADARRSFAGCGGYCEARQARAICHEALKALNLTGRGLDVEFEVCKGDPASYLQLERVAKDAEINAE